MARNTREQLKRVLSENVQRNLENNVEKISEFFLIYSQGNDSAQEVAAALAMVLEMHEQIMIFVKNVNDSI